MKSLAWNRSGNNFNSKVEINKRKAMPADKTVLYEKPNIYIYLI